MSRQAKFVFLLTFVIHFYSITHARPTGPILTSTPVQTAKPPCLLCSWKVAPEIAESANGDACEDLLPASCLDSKGESKIKPMFDRIEKKLKEMVRTARQKAAQQLGYKSVEESILQSLRKEGYILKNDISEKAKKYLSGDEYGNWVEKKEIYEVAAQCAEDQKALQATNIFAIDDVEKLKQFIQSIDDFTAKYKTKTAEYFLHDVPGFINKIGMQCKSLETSNEDLNSKNLLGHPLVVKLQKVCTDKKALRMKAVSFYLQQNDPNTKLEITKFVQEYIDIFGFNLSGLKPLEEEGPQNDLNSLRKKANEKSMVIYNVCSAVEERLEGGPKEITGNMLDLMSKARATVEYLIDQIYTADRKAKVQEIHSSSKREALVVAQRLTRDRQKLARIQDTYKRMVYTWFEKPSADLYVKDKKTGIEVLKLNRFSPFDVWSQAFTSDLSFFTSVNAFYVPDSQFGASKENLSVTMLPIFMEVLDENPYAFLSVMAHEVGHNIGPMMTELNNYNLKEEYTPLLECLGSPDSIRMRDDQADEAVADVISAEVMAKLLNQIPTEKRKAAVYASMQAYCKFVEEGDKEMNVSLTATHPESILRVSGIFGANKSLRAAMSCQNEAQKFRTCSLTGAE